MFEQQPEDIFAGVEPAKQEPLRPQGAVSPTVPGRPGAPAQVGAALSPEEAEEAPAPRKKLFLVIAAVALLIILGAGSYLVWKQFAGKPAAEVINTVPAVINVNTPPVNIPAGPVCGNGVCEIGEDLTNCPTDCPPPAPPPLVGQDTDLDGLPDDEEVTLGTDPNKVDTDNDNLTDREETKIYMTDPLNPDTDGDTYLDGNEVQAGYNPKGPGRLLELPR